MGAIRDRQTFRLSDLIANLSNELRVAQQGVSYQEGDAFLLKGCTIELGVTWERNAQGTIEFWVARLGGGSSRAETESIIISLEPAADSSVVGVK